MRRTVAVLIAALAGAVTAGLGLGVRPAAAGGAVWHFDREAYQPGEVVVAGVGVSWEHNSVLGAPDDGPFYAWIVSSDRLEQLGSEGAAYPSVPAEAERVGEIEIHDEPFELSPTFRIGPHSALVTFTLPDVAPGRYDLLHCNDPCTTTFADITWGVFTVTAPGGAEAPTESTSTSASAGPRSTSPASSSPVPVPQRGQTSATTMVTPPTPTPTPTDAVAVAVAPGRGDGRDWDSAPTIALAASATTAIACLGLLTVRGRRR